jgi:hypothetical protein
MQHLPPMDRDSCRDALAISVELIVDLGFGSRAVSITIASHLQVGDLMTKPAHWFDVHASFLGRPIQAKPAEPRSFVSSASEISSGPVP